MEPFKNFNFSYDLDDLLFFFLKMDPLTVEVLAEKHKNKILKMMKENIDSLKRSLNDLMDDEYFNENDSRFIRFSKEDQKQWLNIPEVEEMIFEVAIKMCRSLHETSWEDAIEIIIEKIKKIVFISI